MRRKGDPADDDFLTRFLAGNEQAEPAGTARSHDQMPPKINPLKLNPLQLKTLTLFQELAKMEGYGTPAEQEGHTMISRLPHPHGDHFHLGGYIVRSQDASGLANESAWAALQRKGLIQSHFPLGCVLTPAGAAYETGLKDQILHEAHHH
ncbi:MAG TPA: hypothetical protein VND94_10745 [Terriglobia bacterium]|nr:hypothetical protein [Terriglobia bacterium]